MNPETQPTFFKKWMPLAVLSLALLIIVLDTTILNVSLRTIIQDLGTTIQKIQWVITAYSLTMAALTITGGRLGDIFGRKKMFVVGAIIFAVGSFITSISHSVGMMVTGEAIIEGIGAALMMPATSSLLVSNYKGRDRQIAFGVWGAIAAGASALGPVFGGWLTTYYSWRWAFRINLVVAFFVIVGALFITEVRDTAEKSELDYVGIVFSSLALLLIVFGFIESSTYGWWTAKAVFMIGNFPFILAGNLSIVVFSIIWGLFFLLLFFVYESWLERKGHTPLVSLNLFKNSQFTVGASIMAIISLGQAGISFAVPVFLQAVLNLDAVKTGVAMLPMSIALLISAPGSSYLSKYIKPKTIVLFGLVVNMLGFFTLRYGVSATAGLWSLAPGFALYGVGMGIMISQVSNMTLSAVSVQQAGEASGVNSTMRLVGQTLGSAILGAILLSALSTNLVSGVNKSTVIPEALKAPLSQQMSAQSSSIEFGSGASSISSNNNLSPVVTSEITTISHQATVDADRATLLYGVLFSFLAFLLALKLPSEVGVELKPEQKLAVGH